jgi:EmrB/QacA subfamily drug resistance transporter
MPPKPDEGEMDPDSTERGSPGWTMTVASLAAFILFLDLTIVNVVLPKIGDDLHVDELRQLQAVIVAYAISLAALLTAAGSIADRVGRRLVFLVGVTTFTGASVACAASGTAAQLIAARTVQGCGAALILATALPLLSVAFPGPERAKAVGLWGAIAGTSIAAGPLLGGVLGTWADWRWVFLVNIPIGVLTVAATLAKVAESRDAKEGRIDGLGAVLISVSLAAVAFGLLTAGELGWSSRSVVASLTVGVGAGVAFAILQARGRHPLVTPSLIGHRPFLATTVVALLFSASLFSAFPYLVLHIQGSEGKSPFLTGLYFLPLAVASMIAAVLAGSRISRGADVGRSAAVGALLIAMGLCSLMLVGDHFRVGWLLAGMVLGGLGAGVMNPPVLTGTVAFAPPEQSGMAAGVVGAARQIGIAMGVAVLGLVIQHRTEHGSTEVEALNSGLAVGIGLALLCAVVAALWMREVQSERS